MPGQKKNGKKEPGLEESFEMLNAIIEKLEEEGTSLEDAFSLYEQGMKLSFHCQETIDTVEKKVRILSETKEPLE